MGTQAGQDDPTMAWAWHGAWVWNMGMESVSDAFTKCILLLVFTYAPGWRARFAWPSTVGVFADHGTQIAVCSLQFMKSGKLMFLVVRVRV